MSDQDAMPSQAAADVRAGLPRAPLGRVLDEDRGSLPYTLVHGEALVAAATWALGQAEVTPVDMDTDWSSIQESGQAYVLHDSLCPLVPGEFIAACLDRSIADDVVVVGVRPVTDTGKAAAGELVRGTVDRDSLVTVASPLVLPASVVATMEHEPGSDLVVLVSDLRREHEVVLLDAPPEGRRVAGSDDVALLESLTAPEHESRYR